MKVAKEYNAMSKTDIISDKSEMLRKYKKKRKTAVLNENFHMESKNKKYLMADDIDNSSSNYKKHKKNYILVDDEVSSFESTSPHLNVDAHSDFVNVDNAFDGCDLILSSELEKKSEKTKKSSHKKKDKKNNLTTVNDFCSTDYTRNLSEIDIGDVLLNKRISHFSINPHENDQKHNIAAGDTSSIVQSLSSPIHKHSPKQRNKCPESSASDTTCEEDSENSAEIRNSPCKEKNKNLHFSLDLDYNEDPVDFEVPPLHAFETVRRLTKKQKEHLPSELCIKTGKFTPAEDKIIQKNFKDFVKAYDVSDTFSLLGLGKYGKDSNFLKFLKAKHFYVRLAKGLNDRFLYSIYKRARKILHPYKNSGKLTKKEIDHLKNLHASVNNKWQWIADTLGSTGERCLETYKWHEKDIAKGKFTEEEETQLVEALKEVSGSSDISCKNIKNINWERVAFFVPSRNASQCRMYWSNNLAWAPNSARKQWTNHCYGKLVHLLKKQNVKDSSAIDWYKIYESLEDFAPSPLYVQKRWLYLKSRVLCYKDKSYEEILNILYDKFLGYS